MSVSRNVFSAPATRNTSAQAKELTERENARTLQNSPYQSIHITEEAPSNNMYIGEQQERYGRWKATASADTTKYMLRNISVRGRSKEDAMNSIKELILLYHRVPYTGISNINDCARVNVVVRTDTHNSHFSITRRLMDTIMHIDGIESIKQHQQVTWNTTNLRKYETALFAHEGETFKLTNTNEDNDVDSINAFIEQLNNMGRGTLTCTIV